jgi:hypothetical protein
VRLEPQQRKTAETIQLSSQHLLTIINQILDFSKIELEQRSRRGRECRGHPRLRRDHSPRKDLESERRAIARIEATRLGLDVRSVVVPATIYDTFYCTGSPGIWIKPTPRATGIDRRSVWGQHSLISPETAPSNVSPKFRSAPKGLDRSALAFRTSRLTGPSFRPSGLAAAPCA